ncbi:PEP-CTERM sorting domain-containing protein [Roseateles sp. P5_E7]
MSSRPLLLATFLAASLVAVTAQAGYVIDEFNTAQSYSACNFPGFSGTNGDMVFGNRLLSGACPNKLTGGVNASVAAGTMTFNFGSLQADVGLSVRSGADPTALIPGPVGPPVDITQGGVNNAFEIAILPTTELLLSISIDGLAGTASLSRTVAASSSWEILTIPFSDFIDGAAIATNLTIFRYTLADPTPEPGGLFGGVTTAGSGQLDFIRAVGGVVPEPGTVLLVALGLAALGFAGRRQS